jgi:hypothetical protein
MGLFDAVKAAAVGRVNTKLSGVSRSASQLINRAGLGSTGIDSSVQRVISGVRGSVNQSINIGLGQLGSVVGSQIGSLGSLGNSRPAVGGLGRLSGFGGSSAASNLLNGIGNQGLGTQRGSARASSRGGNGAGRVAPINPLADAVSRLDPLLSIDWYCTLPLLQGVRSEPRTLPWQMVEEATLPMFEFEPVSNYKAGKTFHYPSHQNLGSLTLKFYEDSSGQSTAFIRNWQSLIFDKETGLYNVPKVHKQIITFTLFDVAKFEVITIRYLGCWPQNPDSYQLIGGSSERITPSVTFSVDDIEMTFNQLTSEATQSLISNVGYDYPSVPNVSTDAFPDPYLGASGLSV